ncbi:MAG: DNA polymerase III subunit chi [Gammaproteobacteria bacterium]|nr:DNA polymerase III subunit chi [Gammaproteobacteria bacterium]
MTLVRFYILEDSHPAAREKFACRLAVKGFNAGVKTFFNMPDARACQRLDELLWTFSDQSFVPHEISTDSESAGCIIAIGHDIEPASDFEVLINMAPDVPHFFSRFQKTFEIIDGHEDNKAQGRSRWSFYKDRGYPLENIPVQ